MSSFRKVTINGVKVWAGENKGEGYPLAPVDHVKDGELCVDCWHGINTYAHVYESGTILRHGEKIGAEADLVEGWAD